MQHIIRYEGMPYEDNNNKNNTNNTNNNSNSNSNSNNNNNNNNIVDKLRYGDLIVVFDVEFPKEISKDRRELLNRLLV